MAFIKYVDPSELDPSERVDDDDNILQIHSVHPRVMRQHLDLYIELMHRPGPLSRGQREMVAIVVSSINACEY